MYKLNVNDRKMIIFETTIAYKSSILFIHPSINSNQTKLCNNIPDFIEHRVNKEGIAAKVNGRNKIILIGIPSNKG